MNPGLSIHRFVMRLALAGAGTFAWIFAVQYYFDELQSVPGALIRTAFLFLLAQVVTALLTPLAARTVRNGVKRSMVYAILCICTAYVMYGAGLAGGLGFDMKYGLLFYALFLGAYRAMYWIPYAVEKSSTPFAKDIVNTAEDFIVAGMPLLFGLTLEAGTGSDISLLFVSAGLVLFSLFPLLFVTEKFERFSWGYAETFGQLLEPRYQSTVWSSILDGAQSATLYFLWPLVVFMLIGYSFASLGAVISLALMLAIPARWFARAYARFWNFESPIVPMVISGSVWLMRLVVATPLGIIFVDTLSVTSPVKTVAAAPPHEHAADGGSFVDEITALKEIGLALGSILMVTVVCSLTLVFTLIQALAVTFIAISFFAMVSIWIQFQKETV